MPDNEIDLHPTRAKLLFGLIVATTVAQITGFFSRTWACKEETINGVKKCDMQGLFYLCTNRGCYGTVINNGIFGLAIIAFVLDLGIGGYICYRILINGDQIAWIWHNKHSKRALSAVYIISRLIDMKNYSRENKCYRYLLNIIDVFKLLAGIGFFVTVGNYAYVGWSSIVFSLPGAALICIILTAIALCLCVVFCGAKYS